MLAYVVLQGIESGLECLLNEGVTILLSGYIDLLANMGEKVYVRNQVGTVIVLPPMETCVFTLRRKILKQKIVQMRR